MTVPAKLNWKPAYDLLVLLAEKLEPLEPAVVAAWNADSRDKSGQEWMKAITDSMDALWAVIDPELPSIARLTHNSVDNISMVAGRHLYPKELWAPFGGNYVLTPGQPPRYKSSQILRAIAETRSFNAQVYGEWIATRNGVA